MRSIQSNPLLFVQSALSLFRPEQPVFDLPLRISRWKALMRVEPIFPERASRAANVRLDHVITSFAGEKRNSAGQLDLVLCHL